MTKAILVLNAGSSSVKYGVFRAEAGNELLMKGVIERIGAGAELREGERHEKLPLSETAGHVDVLQWLATDLSGRIGNIEVVAAGHRVVHGGQEFDHSTLITADVIEQIRLLSPLAPAHQPHNLAGIIALGSVWPDIPQVACFDTAFHRTQPRLAQMFALPRALTAEGVLRYGFHGLSYDYIASQLPKHLGDAANGRVIVLHLGHGASICGMVNRQSMATTMGFTALDGLMMGKRSGDVDPGVIFFLMRDKGLSLKEAEEVISNESGLLGVSGISSDMRDLTASNDPAATEAVDLFCYRAARQVGSMAGAIGGADAIVFTAGVGENAIAVREKILARCTWLGLEIDYAANASGGPRITTHDSAISAWVIPTNEERVIAAQTYELIDGLS
ncbi:acetate/propionate family kinase [uncultured Shimia sp.]|uniref:acetate/propionate family kinase n=1 Tax=uncultured Shimia sp. TaxID=573152 RepID=UPI0026156B76|nr:acetate/propionate family kinase [uncultured Shimia sp.]